MVLKRKRSTDLTPSPSSTTTSVSTIFSDAADSTPNEWPLQAQRNDSGRTMKRLRDARPSEATIHSHTLDLLRDAQRRPMSSTEDEQPVNDDDMVDVELVEEVQCPELPPVPEPGQKGLDAFWSVPAREDRTTVVPMYETHNFQSEIGGESTKGGQKSLWAWIR